MLLFICYSGQETEADIMWHVRKEPYFGLTYPGEQSRLFAPDIISGPFDERMISFIKEGTECYFQIRGVPRSTVFYTHLTALGWTRPETAFFSGYYFEEFTFSGDGNTLVFTSNKPLNPADSVGGEFYIWKSERTDGKWSEPCFLGEQFKGAGYPTISDNGNIYFFDNREEGSGREDIYISEYKNGKYQSPYCLGQEINSRNNEVDPFIAPDESYLIFSSDRNGKGGLFISYKNGENWTKPCYMGDDIGSGESICPSVSSDGRFLFFTSRRKKHSLPDNERITYPVKTKTLNCPVNGSNNIYWVSSDIINRIRPGKCKTEVFKPGIISVENRNEGNLSHSSKYNTFIYRVFSPDKKDPLKLITYSKRGSSEISNQNISIDSEYREWDFNFDRTGKQFYFTSDRPMESNNSESITNSKIWKAAYRNGIWGEPFPLPPPVNLDGSFSGYPSFTDNDLMYFHSNRSEGQGGDDIYRCISAKNSFTQLLNQPYPINTEFNDRDPAISPDGSVLIFFSDRPGGSYPDGDLYICSGNNKAGWNRPMPLGSLIGYAGHPYISDDGSTLFITRQSGSDTDIYKVSLEGILKQYSRFLYLNPITKPELISREIISTEDDEIPLYLSDSFMVFSRTPEGFSDWLNEPIYISHCIDKEWSIPLRLTNSNGSWVRYLPPASIKGRLAFSQQITKANGVSDLDINICDFISPDSINLICPGYPVNTEFTDSWPVLDQEFNLCFFSNRPGGQGDLDLYYSIPEDSHYSSVINMGYPINTRWREHDPAISSDGSILVFASNRNGGYGGDDLYFCYRLEDESWSAPFNLGPEINSEWDENRPVISKDGRSIYFACNRSENLDIYSFKFNYPLRYQQNINYLEEEKPDSIARIFAEDILKNTINIAFTPDGEELFFTCDADSNNTGDILRIRKINKRWTNSEPAPFNSQYTDNDISISPDGRYAYFRSWRPLEGKSPEESVSYIWFSEKNNGHWSEPSPVSFNGQFLQAGYPSAASSGNLYFPKVTDRERGFGDLYYLKREGKLFTRIISLDNDPENLFNEGDMCISPDESYAITSCWERPDTTTGGRSDLYISFRNSDGNWSRLINMGPEINSELMENCPAISPDGKYLFFNRYDGKEAHAYWISIKSINKLKTKYFDEE